MRLAVDAGSCPLAWLFPGRRMCYTQAPRLGIRWACQTFLKPALSSCANCPTEQHKCGAAHAGFNQPLSHCASSIKLPHCCLCTAAVPWVPPSSRLWDSPCSCMSLLKPSPSASSTDLRRLFLKKEDSAACPRWKQVREELRGCSHDPELTDTL